MMDNNQIVDCCTALACEISRSSHFILLVSVDHLGERDFKSAQFVETIDFDRTLLSRINDVENGQRDLGNLVKVV